MSTQILGDWHSVPIRPFHLDYSAPYVPFFLKLGFASGAVLEDLSGPRSFWKPPTVVCVVCTLYDSVYLLLKILRSMKM